MQAYKQGTVVIAKDALEYMNPRTNRRCKLAKGSAHWISSPMFAQQQNGTTELTPKGKPMGTGILVPLDVIAIHFDVIG